jgi:hypothetical protein
VATVFNTDKTLSTILPGVSSANDQFFGVFAYSDLSQHSVGGAGRFYSKDHIKNIHSYIIKWNFQYYLLNAEVRGNGYKLLEIISLLPLNKSVLETVGGGMNKIVLLSL